MPLCREEPVSKVIGLNTIRYDTKDYRSDAVASIIFDDTTVETFFGMVVWRSG